MSTTKLRDDMMEYIETENKSEVRKSTSPSPKDEKKELLKDLDEPTDGHQPGRKVTLVVLEQEKYSNGSYSQKNDLKVPKESTEDGSSTINGTFIPTSGQIVADVEPLKQNGSRGLNISNGVSKNVLNAKSLNGTSEKDAKNGLNSEATSDVSDEVVVKGKHHTSQQMDTSMPEREKSSNSLSLSTAASSKLVESEAPKQSVVIDDKVQQKNELNKKSDVGNLVTEGVESDKDEYRGSGGESTSTADNAAQNKPTDSEVRSLFATQVMQQLNSREIQMKMNKISSLVELITASAFKLPTSTDGDETKPGGPESESADKCEPADEETTFPKRTSKQSEFEDPEELRLMSKKLKMSKSADSTPGERNSAASESRVPKQFRLAYEKASREVPPGQAKRAFNFSETGKSSKKMTKEDLNEIAEKVLRAMSVNNFHQEVDESLFEIGENRTDDSSGEQAEEELESELAPEGYGYVWFSEGTYPKVRISTKGVQRLRSSCDKRDGSKGSAVAFSRSPSDQGETANSGSRRARRETSGRCVQRFPSLFELIKNISFLCCLFPLFLTTYVTMKLFNICFPTEKSSKRPKILKRERSVEDEPPN